MEESNGFHYCIEGAYLLMQTAFDSIQWRNQSFFEQWANFACVRKKRWAKWAGFLLMDQTKY
jgi:hypothetical protein